MTPSGKGRLSPKVTGWVLVLLFAGLVAFFVIPWPKRAEPEPAPMPYVKPPSKLAAYGLPDNPDFELLPEMFEKFARRAEWEKDKTVFAYWHPGAQRYEYFIEATRKGNSYTFRELNIHDEHKLSLEDSYDFDAPEGPIKFISWAAWSSWFLCERNSTIGPQRYPEKLPIAEVKVTTSLGEEAKKPIEPPPIPVLLHPSDGEPKK